MSDQLVPVKCTFCGREWQEDIRHLERVDQEAYRAIIFRGKPRSRIEQYRVRCPHDGTYFIVSVKIEE